VVAEARYIKNRPDLPGPPNDPADSDISVLKPPVPPTEEAVADAEERLEESALNPRDRLGAAGDPDHPVVEGSDRVGGPDVDLRERGSKPRRTQRSKKSAEGEAKS
jgi:hypothetical protein